MNTINNIIKYLLENSLFLLIGAILALVWANTNTEGYEHFIHTELFVMWNTHITLHFVVNEVLMSFFFAMAGKEVWEAMLPGGALNDPKRAATPLIATIGGMAGPAAFYLAGAAILDKTGELGNGWAIPCATDIAFSYIVARLVFGPKHPAIPFLLLLAIADDALGLGVLAVFYPTGNMAPLWLLLSVGGIVLGLLFRRAKIQNHWIYILIPGVMSWVGFMKAGIHPALGLLPIIPTLPHEHTDLGIFMREELERHDTLNEFTSWWRNPTQLILGAFSLLNAGVVFGAVSETTWLVGGALIIGKPIGIFLCGGLAAKVLRCGLPEGMNYRDLVVLGFAAGIGFTVALFVAGVAFPPSVVQDAAKMGALASFGAAITTFIAARILGTKRMF